MAALLSKPVKALSCEHEQLFDHLSPEFYNIISFSILYVV